MPDSDLPLIGASGAVAGVIAAYLMLHPRVSVWVLAFKVIPLRITAGLALGLWIALQIVMVAMPDLGPVAWWAHIGGLIAGAVLIVVPAPARACRCSTRARGSPDAANGCFARERQAISLARRLIGAQLTCIPGTRRFISHLRITREGLRPGTFSRGSASLRRAAQPPRNVSRAQLTLGEPTA